VAQTFLPRDRNCDFIDTLLPSWIGEDWNNTHKQTQTAQEKHQSPHKQPDWIRSPHTSITT